MRLREHPKIQWPPSWSELDAELRRRDEGILRSVDLIEPDKLLLGTEIAGKHYFAELDCLNSAFAARLHEIIKPLIGRPLKEVGDVDF